MKLGLRGQLTSLLLAIALIPLLIYAFFSIRTLTQRLDAEAIATLQAAFDEKAAFIQSWIEAYQGMLATFAEDPRSVAMDTQSLTPWLRSVLDAGHLPFENIGVVDASGLLVAGTHGDHLIGTLQLNDRDYVQAALAGRAFVGEPVVSRATASEVVPISIPIRRSGRVVGALFGTLVTADIHQVLNDTGLVTRGARAYLVSRANQLITRPVQWGERRDEELDLSGAALLALRQGRSGSALRYPDPTGRIVHGVFGRIPNPGWGLIIEQDSAVVDQVRNGAVRAAAGTLLVVALVVAAVAGLAARTVTRPILELRDQLNQLASGEADLSAQVNLRSDNEIGQVAAAFNRFVGNLRGIVGQVKEVSAALLERSKGMADSASQVSTATNEIAATMQQVSNGAHNQATRTQETAQAMAQLQNAIQQIAAGAQEQARRMQETSEIIEQMHSALERVASLAHGVSEASTGDLAAARSAGEAARNAVEGMGRIRTTVAEVAEHVNELGRQSQQIGDIVQIISEIADQTNLLALNAAIEAARAGEHGRGFAVVADEVRKLAERSAQSTRQIEELIASIQGRVEAAVKAMAAGTAEVESGSELVSSAGEALQQIVRGIEQTSQRSQEIAAAVQRVAKDGTEITSRVNDVASITQENTAATEEMSASSEQVAEAVQEIASVSEQTTAAVEEVSAATEQVSAAAEDMKRAVASLAEMAENLERLVGRFKM